MSRNASERQLEKQQHQIDIGKLTPEYSRYINCVPKHRRKPAWKRDWHPETPRVNEKLSKRSFDGVIKLWRRNLHLWSNLTPQQYEALCKDSTLDPHTLKTSANKINVPPVYQTSELIILKKPNEVIEASKQSAEFSKFLARHLIFSDGSARKLIDPNTPVVILPIEFRGMQIWPPCFFLKEEDMILAIEEKMDSLLELQEIQNGVAPRILGIPFYEYLLRKPLISSFDVADREICKQILKTCSITDYTRIKLSKNYEVLSLQTNKVAPLIDTHNYPLWDDYATFFNFYKNLFFTSLRKRF